MADLSWEQVRSQLELEKRLLNLRRDQITVATARNILMRIRVMKTAIRNGDNVDSEVRGRAQALRRRIINIPADVANALTQAEKDERTLAALSEIIAIARMDYAIATPAVRQSYLTSWRDLSDFYGGERGPFFSCNPYRPGISLLVNEVYLWLGVAVIKLRTAGMEVSREEQIALGELELRMASIIGRKTYGEEVKRYVNLSDRLPSNVPFVIEIWCVNFTLSLVVWNAELRLALLAMDVELKRNAILALYPEADLNALAVDDCTCRLCWMQYGEGAEDKTACQPRKSPCCATLLGSSCLLGWFLAGNRVCPHCMKDLKNDIQDNVDALFEPEFIDAVE
jgi:hypothetical protein